MCSTWEEKFFSLSSDLSSVTGYFFSSHPEYLSGSAQWPDLPIPLGSLILLLSIIILSIPWHPSFQTLWPSLVLLLFFFTTFPSFPSVINFFSSLHCLPDQLLPFPVTWLWNYRTFSTSAHGILADFHTAKPYTKLHPTFVEQLHPSKGRANKPVICYQLNLYIKTSRSFTSLAKSQVPGPTMMSPYLCS